MKEVRMAKAQVEVRLVRPAGGTLPLGLLELEADQTIIIGREKGGPDGRGGVIDWGVVRPEVTREEALSFTSRGWHVQLSYDGKDISVCWNKEARNPVQMLNKTEAPEHFVLAAGNSFRIVNFNFTHVPEQGVGGSGVRLNQQIRSTNEVRQYSLADPEKVIDGVKRLIEKFDPDAPEFQLVALVEKELADAIPRATEARIVLVSPDGEITPLRERSGPPMVSRKMIRDAAMQARGRVIGGPDVPEVNPDYSTMGDMWAVCAPAQNTPAGRHVVTVVGTAGTRGSRNGNPDLEHALKVSLLFAELYSSCCRLHGTNDRLRRALQFFPDQVRALFGDPDFEKKLASQKRMVTVLFCDLRDSCGIAEAEGDDLEAQWNNVFQEALEKMSQPIVQNHGVIGSFIGDAVMGFWGWPEANDAAEQNAMAIKAALEIRRNFDRIRQRANSRLAGIGYGIGIAHGPAMVGRLGNYDMAKVDVFGPTVNRAARLEGMTKRFGAEILVDDSVSEALQSVARPAWRLRRIGQIIPVGMKNSVQVSELLPPEIEFNPGTNSRTCNDYARALEEFETGNLDSALTTLNFLSDRGDGPSKFLAETIQGRRSAEVIDGPNNRRNIRMTEK